MNTNDYRPEGYEAVSELGLATLESALESGRILQAKVKKCDTSYNLHLDIPGINAIIPFEECAVGVREGDTKPIAIITRVGRTASFKVMGFKQIGGIKTAVLSRRLAQEDFLENILGKLHRGDIISAKVTRLENFGAFVDVGCGIISLISIDNISVSRISHPKERFSPGQTVAAVITSPLQGSRITLSHKELLGTWIENASKFAPGQIVTGLIRSIESYGVFVELAPNLAGLAEYQEGLTVGETAIVYIKSIIPEKMKIKLSIADHFPDSQKMPVEYFVKGRHIDFWQYSPAGSEKLVETVFTV